MPAGTLGLLGSDTGTSCSLNVTETDLATVVVPLAEACVGKRSNYYPARSQLPEEYSKILLPPNRAKWKSHSNEAENLSVMCWQWLKHLHSVIGPTKPKLLGSWSSVLLPTFQVVCKRTASDVQYFYALSTCSYGAWGCSRNKQTFKVTLGNVSSASPPIH